VIGWARGRMVLVVALAMAARAGAEASPAAQVIAHLDEGILAVMKEGEALGYQGRVERYGPLVVAAYDIPFMAEKSLGQGWKDLSEADRATWIALSRDFSIANYAANFDRFSGQTIEIVGEEPGAAETQIVRTKISDPAGEPIEMNYRLRATDAGWRIVDIYLKGTVSELALRRADYTSMLERSGFETLVATMRARIADLAAGRGRHKSP
jgi:phospholipid transport system substrate-binding protein